MTRWFNNWIGRYISLFGFTLLLPIDAISLSATASDNDSLADGPRKTVGYRYTVVNTTGLPLKNVEFTSDAPVRRNSGQVCCERFSASEGWQLEQDRAGNQRLRLRIASIPPYGRREVRIQAMLRSSDGANTGGIPDHDYLARERFVEVDHPKIQALAKTLRAHNPMVTARRTFRWVADHVQDTGYVREDRGALYALQHGKGDCTEHMYLFIALARANGIPVRAMAGYVVKGNGVLRARDYHNWAEFYADGEWRIADPHRKVFDDGYSDYVATRIIGDRKRTDPEQHRFAHAVEGLEVKMH